MLDRKFIIQNQDLVQQNCDRRGVTVDLPRIVELEKQRLEKLKLSEKLNQQANETSKGIGKAKDDAERQAMKDKGRELREQKDAAQREQDELDAEITELQSVIPNMTHPDVPDGGEDDAKELSLGKTAKPEFEFKPLDHVELGERLQLIDFEDGVCALVHTVLTRASGVVNVAADEVVSLCHDYLSPDCRR